jgi:hypothetical protein
LSVKKKIATPESAKTRKDSPKVQSSRMFRKYSEHGLLLLSLATRVDTRESAIAKLFSHQHIPAMDDCLSDQLLAYVPRPYLPRPFPPLKLALQHQ